MTLSQKLFFELLLVSTGAREGLSRPYADEHWTAAFEIARQQTIAGVLFSALEKLSKEQCPSKAIIFQWFALTEQIERRSRAMGKASDTVCRYFRVNGFPCQILKGRSVARYYSDPLRRSSGDVDIWLDGSRQKIYDFARRFDKDGRLYGVNYHHIHFHLLEEVPIEVHIWPSYLSSPLRNARLHRFCGLYRPTFESDLPSLAFDRVFVLLHCYRHICGDGVGLRQIMDYYYVLRQGFSEDERTSAVQWIRALGMRRFARGIMWVLRQYFGLPEQYLLMTPDEKEGRFIMGEVLQTGNMGHSDTRHWGSKKTALSRFFFNLRRDGFLAGHYPHEAIWQPFFSVWLYFWRLFNGLLKDRADND